MILGNTVESIGDDGFTIIVLPDTQHYVQKDKYPETLKCFESQIQWIIENREKLNIVFVSHVGDITESYGTEEGEFLRAIVYFNSGAITGTSLVTICVECGVRLS